MSTRATIRFATREEGVSLDEHPQIWNAQFYDSTSDWLSLKD